MTRAAASSAEDLSLALQMAGLGCGSKLPRLSALRRLCPDGHWVGSLGMVICIIKSWAISFKDESSCNTGQVTPDPEFTEMWGRRRN